MRQPERGSSLYQLSISRAPKLRCVNSPVKSCGICEDCCLGAKLKHTKEWFCRCGEPIKRRYILGLVERFDSMDLLEYVTSLLQSFQYKDFTYMRSRSKPSLIIDTSSPPTNHALNENELLETIESYLEWFSVSTYWTKANYLLCLMQLCDTHILHIVAVKTRALCEREHRRQRAFEDGLIDRGLFIVLVVTGRSAKERNEHCACICLVLSAMIEKLAIRMYIPPSLRPPIRQKQLGN